MTTKQCTTLAAAFQALCNPTRVALIAHLRAGARTVTELTARLRATQPTVSHHLGILRWHKMVEARRDGRCVIYRLRPDGLKAAKLFIGAAADYEVLCHVREKWEPVPQSRFAEALITIWNRRRIEQPRPLSRSDILYYHPGDYSRAALMAKEMT